jgi:hypothetical protein
MIDKRLHSLLRSSGCDAVECKGDNWQGSRLACDEYFERNCIPLPLNDSEYEGRNSLES